MYQDYEISEIFRIFYKKNLRKFTQESKTANFRKKGNTKIKIALVSST
jgi:hypothetical protein